MTSQDQANRLLVLVPYLQVHPGAKVDEVAAAFKITPAQLLRDLNVAWMCGLPGGLPGDLIEIDMDAAEGEGVINLTNADYLTRPLRFTLDEVMSLIVALQAVREVATGQTTRAADSVLAKLSALVSGREVDRVAIKVASGSQDVRDALVRAIEGRQQVRLTYDGQTRGETTTPLVDPTTIWMRDGYAYLWGWSVERDAWRSYRLDRVVAVQQLGASALPHGEPPTGSSGWFDELCADNEVVLELAADAAWVTEYYPMRSVQRHSDGGVRATVVVSDPAWLTGLLLRLGPSAQLISPHDAGVDAAREAQATLLLARKWLGGEPLSG